MYMRMFISLLVTLYTSRVLLQELGFENFGIYGVVGGVVTLFSFLNSSMSTATSRFFNFEIGRSGDVQAVFSSAIIIHAMIAILVLIIGAIVGFSVIFQYLNISEERLIAAKWVYSFSLLTSFVTILQVPYASLIVSYERFKIFAYFDLVSVFLKLGIAFSLILTNTDKLVTYSILVFAVSLLSFIANVIYVAFNFNVSNLKIRMSHELTKKMLSFSGWDLYGNASVLARTQGVNILLNLFFGALMNAASGIATQVQGAVMSFATSVLAAVKPQIVKSYASGDYERVSWLVLNTAKFTYLILFMVTLPLVVEMNYVLELWLNNVPDFAVSFCQYVLIFNLFASMSSVVITAIHATGHIKRPSLINGTLYLLVIPISYLAFEFDYSAIVAFQVNIVMVIIGMLSNAWTLNKLLPEFSFSKFICKVILPCIGSAIFISLIILFFMQTITPGFHRLIYVSIMSFLLISIVGYCIFIDRDMKEMMKKFILNKIKPSHELQ